MFHSGENLEMIVIFHFNQDVLRASSKFQGECMIDFYGENETEVSRDILRKRERFNGRMAKPSLEGNRH